MDCTRMCAGDEGVEPLDLVHEAVLDKKIQRAVCDGRLTSEAGITQAIQQFVGAQGPMLAGGFKSRTPHRRKRAGRGTTRFGLGDRSFNTLVVIMGVEPDRPAVARAASDFF